ncbi:hypothetical protein [Streptomyces sp. NPDC001851]
MTREATFVFFGGGAWCLVRAGKQRVRGRPRVRARIAVVRDPPVSTPT